MPGPASLGKPQEASSRRGVNVAQWTSRSASGRRRARPTGSTTSPSSRAGGRATLTTSTSAGRSASTSSSFPLLASAMDGVVSPATAVQIGRLGGLGVLNLEGIFTRYVKPDEHLERIAAFSPEEATRGMQKIYAQPVDPDLVGQADPRDQGRRGAGGGLAHAAARARLPRDRGRRGPRRARHPGDGRLGRARLVERLGARPDRARRRARHPRDRRRLRLLPRRAPPDAHRRGRSPRRRRARAPPARRAASSGSASRRRPRSPMRPRPARSTSSTPAAT